MKTLFFGFFKYEYMGYMYILNIYSLQSIEIWNIYIDKLIRSKKQKKDLQAFVVG